MGQCNEKAMLGRNRWEIIENECEILEGAYEGKKLAHCMQSGPGEPKRLLL